MLQGLVRRALVRVETVRQRPEQMKSSKSRGLSSPPMSAPMQKELQSRFLNGHGISIFVTSGYQQVKRGPFLRLRRKSFFARLMRCVQMRRNIKRHYEMP